MVEEQKSIIEEWLNEWGKQRGQTGWTGRTGWLNVNNKLMTSLITIISGEFAEGKTYVISGMLRSVIKNSELHIVIRQPHKKEYMIDVVTDKNGNFYAEIIADTGGAYIISVEYNCKTTIRLRTVNVSLLVAVLELNSFESFVKDANMPKTASIHI
jgi:uncharacterized protein (UPF0128 family)